MKDKNLRKIGYKVGRPSKYKPSFCKKMIDFFSVSHTKEVEKEKIVTKDGRELVRKEIVANDLPLFGYFAVKIGVNPDSLAEWRKVHPAFSEAYRVCKKLQEDMLTQNTINGLYESKFAMFLAKNITDWRDSVDLKHSGDKENPIVIKKYEDLSDAELEALIKEKVNPRDEGKDS